MTTTSTCFLFSFIFTLYHYANAQCGTTLFLNATSGSFSSGSEISNDLTCSWLIEPAGASYVELIVNITSLDESTTDTLTIYDITDGNGNIISGPFTGNISDIPDIPIIYSKTPSVFVVFTTTSPNTTADFTISYYAVQGIAPSCSGLLYQTSSNGSISDGSGQASYTDNLDCEWLIEPNQATSVALKMTSFSTEENDTVFIYDGPSTDYPLLANYSGSYEYATQPIVSSSGSLLVVFQTDQANTGSGWSFEYSSSIAIPSASSVPSLPPSSSSPIPSASSVPSIEPSMSPEASPMVSPSAEPSLDVSPSTEPTPSVQPSTYPEASSSPTKPAASPTSSPSPLVSSSSSPHTSPIIPSRSPVTISPSSSPQSGGTSNGHKGLSSGAIAGIMIPLLGVASVGGVIAFLLIRKHRKKALARQMHEELEKHGLLTNNSEEEEEYY